MTHRKFLIADTHFGHANILKYSESRRSLGYTIDEHDAALVQRWNSVVGKNDTVYHLGDVAFGKAQLAILEQCNGIKYLCLGNHDNYASVDYLKYFNKVYGVKEIANDIVLSHVPLVLDLPKDENRWQYNIHGHCHDRPEPSSRHLCVSVERTQYAPMAMEEALAIIEGRKRMHHTRLYGSFF